MLFRRVPVASLLLLLALSAVPQPATAAWPHNPGINLPVSTAAGTQDYPAIVADGAGGAFVTWKDSRNGIGYDIYAQHLLASGAVDSAWPVNGLALCTAISAQDRPTIVADGAGGAIVTWRDSRSGNFDIYAQHVLVSGATDPAWPVNGRALCTAINQQFSPKIVEDGAGGAFVTWYDYRSPSGIPDIYAQHVLASGGVDGAWPPNGLALCTAANEQISPTIAADGAGGAIVAWNDNRSGSYGIYAQHVLASGAVDGAWPVDGRALCTNTGFGGTSPRIITDGAGGAIVTWDDMRNGDSNPANPDIYAQHVLASGAVDGVWPVNGRALCNAADRQLYPTLVSDGSGGAFVTWQDNRVGSSDIYAQHVLPSGAVDGAWPVNGRALCTAVSNQHDPAIVADGAGGVIVTWYDSRSGNTDIYAQHVLASGAVDGAWPADGRALSIAANRQDYPAIVGDGAGGAIVTWWDLRSGANFDIYAQRVERFGRLGNPEPASLDVRDVVNDQGGRVLLEWTASYLDVFPTFEVESYSIWRQISSGPQFAAERAAVDVRNGASVRALGAVFRLPRFGAQAQDWEYLGSVPARGFAGYSYVAPTTSDSLPGSNPLTSFMVIAEAAGGIPYWASAPDSGYSVDNLPPGTPAPFTGNYSAGATHLHWNPNSEPDLANYRLYRGTSESFVPGPGNLIAAPSDTGYTDPGPAGSYYKLSAVDIHGNESGFALLAPGTTDAPGGALPRQLYLARPVPNPARGIAIIRFGLPSEARVRLAIYDAGGRQVRELSRGLLPGGEHAVSWDGRDASGHAVASGLYLVKLEADGRTLTQKLVEAR